MCLALCAWVDNATKATVCLDYEMIALPVTANLSTSGTLPHHLCAYLA